MPRNTLTTGADPSGSVMPCWAGCGALPSVRLCTSIIVVSTILTIIHRLNFLGLEPVGFFSRPLSRPAPHAKVHGPRCPTSLSLQFSKRFHCGVDDDEPETAVATVVPIVAEGNIPGPVDPRITHAPPTATTKKDGGHRWPWERLFDVSQRKLATVSKDMTRYFRPTQGLGTQNGCEPIVHAVRRWLQKHDNDQTRCLLAEDLENAFNQIDRSFFLREIRRVPLAWLDTAACTVKATALSCLVQKRPRAGEVYNKANLQAHCSSPSVSREPSLRAEHKLRSPAALWTQKLFFFSTTEWWAAHMRPLRLFMWVSETHDPTRLPPVRGHSSHPSSFLPRLMQGGQRMQTSLKNCLGGIIQVPITEDAWLWARASIKKGGFGIRDLPCPPLPAAFLTSSSSTSSLCHSLWSEYEDTLDPHVTVAETQFRLSVQEDAAWRLDGATRTTERPVQPVGRTLDTLMQQATQGTHLSLTETPISHVPPCNTASTSSSSTRTHNDPFVPPSPCSLLRTLSDLLTHRKCRHIPVAHVFCEAFSV